MFLYYLRMSIKSLRKTFWLTCLMVGAIALGIGASMTTITVNYLMSADPIAHKSQQLYYVQLDSWSPHFAARDPNEPPDQLTWRDATNLVSYQKAFRQTANASTSGVVESDQQDVKPFMASIRLNFADFFPMFDAPFLYGQGWEYDDDIARKQWIVISKEINDRVFGGENSVGRSLKVAGHSFTVVGVLDEWVLVPRFYDVTTGAFDETEEIFMPFYLKETLELPNGGNTNCWKSPEGEGFQAFLQSECVNFQMWVELPTAQDKAAYLDFLNDYVDEQKALGRFARPLNNRLSNVMEWMEIERVVAEDAQVMMYLSFLFLFVCIVNTVGLLLSKFTSRTADVALRRAIGASRGAIFAQYITESAIVGVLGGLLGLGLAALGLAGIRTLYGEFLSNLVSLDFNMVALAIGLSIFAAVIAGCFPAWRVCQIAPASQLKTQ